MSSAKHLFACLPLVMAACASSSTHPPGLQSTGNGLPPPPGSNAVKGEDSGAVTGPAVGTIQTLATGIAAPTALALGASDVYWVDASGGVWSVPITGGATSRLASGQSAPARIFVDTAAGVLLWSSSGAGQMGGGSIASLDLASGTATTLASNLVQPYGVAGNGTDAYFSDVSQAEPGVEVDQAPIAGGATLELGISFDDIAPGGLAIDGSNAYFASAADGGGGSVAFVPLAGGGEPDTLWESTAGAPSNLVLAGSWLVWVVDSASPEGAVWAVTVPSGKPAALASGIDHPQDVASDGASAYFTVPSLGQVYAVPLGGGSATALASGLSSPGAIAVGDAVYVGTADAIVRLAK